jgi:hypothetical protein
MNGIGLALVIVLALYGVADLAWRGIGRALIWWTARSKRTSARLAKRIPPEPPARAPFPGRLVIPLAAFIGALLVLALVLSLEARRAQAVVDALPQARATVVEPEPPPERGRAVAMDATWYGEKYRGRPTASGEPFNPDDFTFAHRTLAFGDEAEVLGLDGVWRRGRCNDRGPWCKHGPSCTLPCKRADIDLSEALAEASGLKTVDRARLAVRRLL